MFWLFLPHFQWPQTKVCCKKSDPIASKFLFLQLGKAGYLQLVPPVGVVRYLVVCMRSCIGGSELLHPVGLGLIVNVTRSCSLGLRLRSQYFKYRVSENT